MGLLGSGGQSFGAVPYVPHVWYRIDLTFNWADKEVRAQHLPRTAARPPAGIQPLARRPRAASR